MNVYEYIRNIFFFLIILQIAPSFLQNIGKQYKKLLTPKTNVGVMAIKGVLYDSNAHIKQLKKFFKHEDIKAILLKIECSGSASGTGEAIHQEIQLLKQTYKKPIIALVENMAASGGYLVAAACDHIVAPGMATIGSIGVTYSYLFQLKELLEKHTIGYVSIKAGEYKTIGDMFTNMSEKERALLQNILDNTYEQFKQIIMNTRPVDQSDTTIWAEGKIFTGQQAQQIGLIDTLGSFSQAVHILKEKANITTDIHWVMPIPKGGFLSMLSGAQDGSSYMHSTLDAALHYITQKSTITTL